MTIVSPTREQERVLDALVRHVSVGDHVALFGPVGMGKTTLIEILRARLTGSGMAPRVAQHVGALADLSHVMGAEPSGGSPSVRRARARTAAARASVVLLLDHVTTAGTATKAELRRLREASIGVVLAIDVDASRETEALRAARLAPHLLAAPSVSTLLLRALLMSMVASHARVPRGDDVGFLAAAARGRPGWIVECVRLLAQPDYWTSAGVRRLLLRGDVDLALWQRRRPLTTKVASLCDHSARS